jgi:sugar/nucleoside kinase (ribokinase family)
VTEKTLDILSFGEPLMEFAEVERDGEKLYLPGFGGDSSNAAIAAARQGARVAYFTALGDDAFGQGFLDLWDREGVERASVATRPGGRTGLYSSPTDRKATSSAIFAPAPPRASSRRRTCRWRGSPRPACCTCPASARRSPRPAPMRASQPCATRGRTARR